MRTFLMTLLALSLGLTAACGKGDKGSTPPPTDNTPITYAVRVTVSGLVGTVVLQNNGGDDLTISANGQHAFATHVEVAAHTRSTVLTQPASPLQTCSVQKRRGNDRGRGCHRRYAHLRNQHLLRLSHG